MVTLNIVNCVIYFVCNVTLKKEKQNNNNNNNNYNITYIRYYVVHNGDLKPGMERNPV